MTETETVPSEAGEGASTTSSQYIITAYEDAFKDRYTETDKEYIKTKETKLPDPPCVENWYSKPKRSWDWSRFVTLKLWFVTLKLPASTF